MKISWSDRELIYNIVIKLWKIHSSSLSFVDIVVGGGNSHFSSTSWLSFHDFRTFSITIGLSTCLQKSSLKPGRLVNTLLKNSRRDFINSSRTADFIAKCSFATSCTFSLNFWMQFKLLLFLLTLLINF